MSRNRANPLGVEPEMSKGELVKCYRELERIVSLLTQMRDQFRSAPKGSIVDFQALNKALIEINQMKLNLAARIGEMYLDELQSSPEPPSKPLPVVTLRAG